MVGLMIRIVGVSSIKEDWSRSRVCSCAWWDVQGSVKIKPCGARDNAVHTAHTARHEQTSFGWGGVYVVAFGECEEGQHFAFSCRSKFEIPTFRTLLFACVLLSTQLRPPPQQHWHDKHKAKKALVTMAYL